MLFNHPPPLEFLWIVLYHHFPHWTCHFVAYLWDWPRSSSRNVVLIKKKWYSMTVSPFKWSLLDNMLKHRTSCRTNNPFSPMTRQRCFGTSPASPIERDGQGEVPSGGWVGCWDDKELDDQEKNCMMCQCAQFFCLVRSGLRWLAPTLQEKHITCMA